MKKIKEASYKPANPALVAPPSIYPSLQKTTTSSSGFTLVGLAFVLVAVGLICGIVIVGEDMVNASAIRSQVTQIEQYQAIVTTFQTKYSGKLPGDIDAKTATQFGLAARGGGPGDGDGNGIIEGLCNGGQTIGAGETSLFWNDLTTAGLIEEKFIYNTENYITTIEASQSIGRTVNNYLPAAKIGHTNYIYVWSGGYGVDRGTGGQGGWSDPNNCGLTESFKGDSTNYFGLSRLPEGIMFGEPNASQGLTVIQAYSIDRKMDDGMPQSGKVIAMYPNNNSKNPIIWAQVNQAYNTAPTLNDTGANPGSYKTCFDNSDSKNGAPGVEGATQHYSTEINKGGGLSCALSFAFQE